MSGVEYRLLDLHRSPSKESSTSSGKENSNSQRISNSENPNCFLGALAFITLTDPKQNGNGLDAKLLRSLILQLQDWQNCNIRAIILRSSSNTAFSVGMDLTVFQIRDSMGQAATSETAAFLYRQCLDSIFCFPAPVLCLLEKPARAGGVGLAMAADLVIAAPEASLNLSEALFGLIPANVMPYLRKRISERKANQMVFLPEAIDAQTSLQWGLVDFVTSEIEKVLKKLLRSILRCSPAALAEQKALGTQLSNLPWNQQQELAEKTLARLLDECAVEAGISAFLSGSLGPWCAKVSPFNNIINQ